MSSAGWAALYSGSAVLRTLVAFVHVAGLVGGGGAAIAADRATLKATRAASRSRGSRSTAIHNTHRVVIVGLGRVYRQRRAALYRRRRHLRAVEAVLAEDGDGRGADDQRRDSGPRRPRRAEPDEGTRRTMRWTAGLSLALWFLTTLAGAGLPNI